MERNKSLADQIKKKVNKEESPLEFNDGNFSHVISTGSTLLDLAISGGRIRGGGIPGGIFIEIFGAEATGKSALACEISGDIQRKGGIVRFDDPEGRLDAQYAQMFGVHLTDKNYFQSDTITQVFAPIEKWKPDNNAVNGIIVDSLAALSTDMELAEGDKMGGRRGKEFSQELRKACRYIKQRNFLMVCTNQIRDTMATFGKKSDSTGGHAIRFHASLRLETEFPMKNSKIIKKKTVDGRDYSKIVGINVNVKVVKNSVWEPYHVAPLSILFSYGIDDVRANLAYLKDEYDSTTYTAGGKSIGKSIDEAIMKIEKENLESALKEEVIDHWMKVEIDNFKTDRKPKR